MQVAPELAAVCSLACTSVQVLHRLQSREMSHLLTNSKHRSNLVINSGTFFLHPTQNWERKPIYEELPEILIKKNPSVLRLSI